MLDVYPLLLQEILRSKNIENKNIRDFLLSLRPSTRSLADRLRDTYNPRTVLGTEEESLSYLLKYYPLYSKISENILFQLSSAYDIGNLLDKPVIKVVLLGAGPAPEILGVSSFLDSITKRNISLDVTCLDSNNAQWAASREIAVNFINSAFGYNRISNIDHFDFDLTKDAEKRVSTATKHRLVPERPLANCINQADIFISQNLINEIADKDLESSERSLSILFNELKAGAIAIAAEVNMNKPFVGYRRYRNSERVLTKVFSSICRESDEFLVTSPDIEDFEVDRATVRKEVYLGVSNALTEILLPDHARKDEAPFTNSADMAWRKARLGFCYFSVIRQGYKDGYDIFGYDSEGYDSGGYNEEGYDSSGYNKSGYDKEGYDAEGYREGYDRSGYDRSGYNSEGFNPRGYDKRFYNRNGLHRDGFYRMKHSDKIVVGDKVRHAVHGDGLVCRIEGSSNRARIVIDIAETGELLTLPMDYTLLKKLSEEHR
jgi:hypothetical protein